MGRQARLKAEKRELGLNKEKKALKKEELVRFNSKQQPSNHEKKARQLRLTIARGKGKGKGSGNIYTDIEIDFEHRCVFFDMFKNTEEKWRIHSMELIVY